MILIIFTLCIALVAFVLALFITYSGTTAIIVFLVTWFIGFVVALVLCVIGDVMAQRGRRA